MYKIIEKVSLIVYVHLQGGKRTESKDIRKRSAEGAERFQSKGPKIYFKDSCITKITTENKQIYAAFPNFSHKFLLPQTYFVSLHVFIFLSSSLFHLLCLSSSLPILNPVVWIDAMSSTTVGQKYGPKTNS